jgi:hypothetical protein
MADKKELSEEQSKVLDDLFNSISGGWWSKLKTYSDEISMYDSLFGVLLSASMKGLFDEKFQSVLDSFLKELKEEEEKEICVFFNSEEMATMKNLKWLLERSCETDRQFKVTFELKSRIIKKRAFYRHLFSTVKAKIRSGEYECHKEIKDLLKKAPW